VLDWGHQGLIETLETLEKAGIRTAGAGRYRKQAEAPAIIETPGKGRVIVFSFGDKSSGIPRDWAPSPGRPGVNLLPDLSDGTVSRVVEQVKAVKQSGDLVVASVHWGGNWGYEVPRPQRVFAHTLIDAAGVDIVHGHSSHHPKAIEIYRERPILYGCGDFLDDYEGIGGYQQYRDDLVLMYFPTVDPQSGRLVDFRMTPLQIRNFRLNRPSPKDAAWLREVLDRECRVLGARVEASDHGGFRLRWS
jgi:poly-gamma-glutamate synthesis protein (capsule biosynthesis protein)